jgi:sortase A
MRPLDVALGLLGEVLITLGVLLLLFIGWQLWWTDFTAGQVQAQLTEQMRADWADSAAPGGSPSEPVVMAEPEEGVAFGLVHIPRFGSGYEPKPVLQGTSADVLEEGMGHYVGTAMPGAIGNVAIAGHRVTYGRPLFQVEELQIGDAIVVETADGWFTYRVTGTEIVKPRQVDVIAPVPNQPGVAPTERQLTLTACHPQYSAKERFIVHALYDSWQPRIAGPPPSLALPEGVD